MTVSSSAPERDLAPADYLSLAVAALGGSPREGQVRMVEAIADALEAGEAALVQAGTGTGKSLGYLVPAVVRAVTRHERIVVSTATLALQRQVYTKDLPLVVEALEPVLGERARIGLMKGRANYVCRHKLAGGYPAPDELDGLPLNLGPTSELGRQVARVHEWAAQTDTGDRDDLVPGVPGRAWAQVSVQGRECLDSKCPLVDECFSQRARDEAAAAHIVVTNHAVLGIQATGHDLLGEHDALIVDEAHELVSRITSSATHELTVRSVDRAARAARRCGVTTDHLDRAARALDAALGEERPRRLRDGLPEALAQAVELIRSGARDAASAVGKAADKDGAAAKMASAALAEVNDVCEELQGEHGRHVVWLAPPEGEYDSPTPARVVTAPLNVAALIGGKIVGERPAVFTSATLTLGGGFGAISAHLGLTEPATLDAGSPFDYTRQGILYVARHLPRPGTGGISAEALDELEELMRAAGGRTLGLFSSHKAAQTAAEEMRERLDVPVLYQRDDQVSTLVEQFKSDPRTCLFGSTTLWQGVDLPGATASLVVMDRIPFPRPDDPIMQARTEEADAFRPGSGFMAVSVTHAALLMAQGAGRLVRTHTDKGVVAVLDSRFASAGYGGFLRNSLPPLWPTSDRQVVLGALQRLDAEAAAAGE